MGPRRTHDSLRLLSPAGLVRPRIRPARPGYAVIPCFLRHSGPPRDEGLSLIAKWVGWPGKDQADLTLGCGVRYTDGKYRGHRAHGVAHRVRCAQATRSGADETQRTSVTMSDTRPRVDGQAVRSSHRGRGVPDSGLVKEPARDPVAAAAVRRPDGIALVAGNTTLTWAHVDARVTE